METDYAKEAQKWDKYSLPTLAMHVWLSCCQKYGSGGTPEANKAYKKILQAIFFELDIPTNQP